MTPEERAQRMLERLPVLLQTGPNLRRLFEAMGRELEVMERATRRLLESRWYRLARGFDAGDSLAGKASSELGSIGALVDLHPGRGESADYFRRHIAELVRLHSRGLTTADAILRLVSFVYLADQPPVIEQSGEHAIGRFTVYGEDGVPREIRVEIIDNPPSAASATIFSAEPHQQLLTYNAGLDQALPAIGLTAAGGDVTVPLLHHEESGVDVIFLGTIQQGQTLALRHKLPPLLDGAPPGSPVLMANPTRFASSATDDHVFRFDTPEARFSFCEVSHNLPPLPPGESHWRYTTMSRAELHAYIGDRPGLDGYVTRALVQAVSPPIDIVFRWTEVTPTSFELRIPAGYVPPHYRDDHAWGAPLDMIAFVRDIQAALEYGRAAGVRATVGMMLPLEAESVAIDEGPLRMTLDIAFAEEPAAEDKLATFGPSIDFGEALPQPEETFTFGGLFNTTRFNGSMFQ